MKLVISLLALNFVFSAAMTAEAATALRALPMISEYDCDGEDDEHSILMNVVFEEDLKIYRMDFLQSTQHNQGPFPLLPLKFGLNDLQGRFHQDQMEYPFSPGNYQDCNYRWVWPLEVDSEDEVLSTLKMDCDGVRSEIQLSCSRNDF